MNALIKALCLLLCMAACGGGGGGGADGTGEETGGEDGQTGDDVTVIPPDPRLAILDRYEGIKLRVLGDPDRGIAGLPMTPLPELPQTGTINYAGYATMRIETGPQPLILFGDASLAVNFGTGASTGNVTGVFGGRNGEAIPDYDGSLSLQGATVGAQVPLSYVGNLQAGAQTLAFDGQMTGFFLGAGAAGFAAGDVEARIGVTGTATDGTVAVTLEAGGG